MVLYWLQWHYSRQIDGSTESNSDEDWKVKQQDEIVLSLELTEWKLYLDDILLIGN